MKMEKLDGKNYMPICACDEVLTISPDLPICGRPEGLTICLNLAVHGQR